MRRSTGFTLLEMTVAIAVAGVVALLAHHAFAGVVDAMRGVAEARRSLDREITAGRWLSDAFGSLDVGGEAGGFAGRRDAVEFGTWLPHVDGSSKRHRVFLSNRGGTLTLDGPYRLELLPEVQRLDIDYLLEPGANAVWVQEWISPVSAPLAVRLRARRSARTDTLLFIVGSRG